MEIFFSSSILVLHFRTILKLLQRGKNSSRDDFDSNFLREAISIARNSKILLHLSRFQNFISTYNRLDQLMTLKYHDSSYPSPIRIEEFWLFSKTWTVPWEEKGGG